MDTTTAADGGDPETSDLQAISKELYTVQEAYDGHLWQKYHLTYYGDAVIGIVPFQSLFRLLYEGGRDYPVYPGHKLLNNDYVEPVP